jgi:hypothetical protein
MEQQSCERKCKLYQKRNKDARIWKQKSEYFDRQNPQIPFERERLSKIAHRSHSYRQSKQNDRMFSTECSRTTKAGRRRSGSFFQFSVPKRNEGIQYYSPQLEKKCNSNYYKPSTSNYLPACKGHTQSNNVSSFYTDTYPVSNDYDYCSSCSSSSISSSSSDDDNDDDSRFSRQIGKGMEKRVPSRNKKELELTNPFPYYGGVRASYLPNDRIRVLKQKKMEEEVLKRKHDYKNYALVQRSEFNRQGNNTDVACGQPVVRPRDVEQRKRMPRPLSEHFLVSDGGYSMNNNNEGFAEATYRNGNMNSLVEVESGTNIRRLRKKELKNKNCIVS